MTGSCPASESDSQPGPRFHRWTVLYRIPRREFAMARCDCGTVRRVQLHHLRSGASKSCGCLPPRAQDDYESMLYWSDRAHVFVPPTMAGIGHPAEQRCCLLCGGERTEYQHQPPEGFRASWERQGWRPEDTEPDESWADWLRRTAH